MTEYPVFDGALEIRQRGAARVLAGSFPYGRTATIRASGRTRKERFKRGSMQYQPREFQRLQEELDRVVSDATADAERLAALEDALERRNTHLLVGHDYNRAIADMKTGNLSLSFSDEGVAFEAALPPEDEMPTWVMDAVKAVRGGQLRGVSPGFQVPAKGAERLIPEPGNPGVMIREIEDAVVFEYSLVARPAYSGTDVSARHDAVHGAQDTKPRGATLWL